MKRVLFVCLGNICRSPMAEAIFNRQVLEKGLEKSFQADSCGTANYHVGDAPDPRTVRTSLKNGTPIRHTGRQFSRLDFEQFDLILPMGSSNRSNLRALPGAEKFDEKIMLMRMFDPDQSEMEVPDPYYGTEKDSQHVFEMLDRSIQHLIEVLEKESPAT